MGASPLLTLALLAAEREQQRRAAGELCDLGEPMTDLPTSGPDFVWNITKMHVDFDLIAWSPNPLNGYSR